MKVFRIQDPVPGEQLLVVEPRMQRYPAADWRQRLEYFAGRALTHSALRLEQTSRAGHLATLGQALSPGVVDGLEAVAQTQASGVVIEIAAGSGLTASGEVVSLNRNHQVLLDDLRVYAPASVLEGEGDFGAGAYTLGDTLGELRVAGRPLPRALILVLQPVTVQHYDEEVSTDPCDHDPGEEAFENWQWVDGFRLILHSWPAQPVPVPVPGQWFRNRLAYAVFEQERQLAEGEYLPWFAAGVPIAMIGFDQALAFAFLDRHAVVRRGGEAKGGGVPITPAGTRFLWQARFEQYNEQLAEWLLSASELDPEKTEAATEFRYLPPVGVLPREFLNPRRQRQSFFPASYTVRALALPYEQLDRAIDESAGLLPYDLHTPDHVEVLVPVPQQHFDPALLVVETIDPVFDQSVTRFTAGRDEWLGRRLIVRNRASVIYKAIKGRPLLFPAADPDAVDALEQPIEFERKLVKRGDRCSLLKGTVAPPLDWFQNDFDDADWLTDQETDLGYGAGRDVGTVLDDMRGGYLTLFVRHRFEVESLSQAHRYTLVVSTNGGFYAYLNGSLLTSANVTRPLFNVPAREPQTLEPRRYELGALGGRLQRGENVLAIQAHNASLDEQAFRISVELVDTEDAFGTVEIVPPSQEGAAPFGEEQYGLPAVDQLREHLEAHTPLSDTEVAHLDEVGLEAYIQFLQEKIDKADDRVEFGFLRVRTDIYRVRQMMLGNEVGTKLATSPALAEIAKGQSAVATREELSRFYERIKLAGANGDSDGNGHEPIAGRGSALPTSGIRATPMTPPPVRDNLFFSGDLASIDLGDQGRRIAIDGDVMAGQPITGRDGITSSERSSAALFNVSKNRDVQLQNPIVGKVQHFNNATVGERLEEASANVAYQAGVAVKVELIMELLDTVINVDDLSVPGVAEWEDDKLRTFSFAQIRADKEVMGKLRGGGYDMVQKDDEATYFNAGVKALENTIGILRLIEGRIRAYRLALERCKGTLAQLQRQLGQADGRLKSIGDELAEARHDVSVARSLKAEEQVRIERLNAARDSILDTLVPFLLFRRPRTVDPRRDAPVHYLNPDLSEQPLPLCDLAEVETPEAVEAMLDVVRDAPLKWFARVLRVLPQLSRLADLHVTLASARRRATSSVAVHPFIKTNFQTPDRLLQGLGTVLGKSQARIHSERRKTVAIDLAAFQRLGWQESIQHVPEVVSLGDLIDAHHGRMLASQRAADEMAMIARVATCLYVEFSRLPAAIRLHWAERLSQYDTPADLRNLYSLPRFGDLDYIARHTMQRLVDWLFGGVTGQYSDALAMTSDLIRVTLLAASHAPVNQLIAGYLPAPVTLRPGSWVNVAADLSRVRIGMAVSIVSAGATLVRGRVADIVDGQVTAEVHTVVGDSVQLDAGARVQIGERTGMLGQDAPPLNPH